MTDSFVFLNEPWFWPVIIGSVFVFSFFVWKEWPNSSKKRFSIKIAVSILTIVSLALIALRPALQDELETGLAVLITEGADNSRLDSLEKAHKNIKKIIYSKNRSLQRQLDSVSSLFVLGHGPEPFDLWQFEEIPVTYLGGEPIKGIVKLKYDVQNTTGNNLKINGLYQNPKKGNRIVVQTPGGAGLDSVFLDDMPSQRFRFSVDLKVLGDFVYKLTEKDSTGLEINSEPAPISVVRKNPLRIMMINSFPTFESKYLKNFLAEMGHKVLVRSQLTKGKYKFEYLNTERTPIYRLSQENLKNFDIVFIDTDSYMNLSSRSFETLINAVKDDGLGIFIQPNTSFFQLSESKSHFKFDRLSTTEVSLSQWPKIKLRNYPYSLKDDFLVEPIHVSKKSILSALKRIGRGRAGSTVFQDTYRLMLDGKISVYRQLWTEIIGAIANKETISTEYESEIMFVVENHPFDFKLRRSKSSSALLGKGNNQIPLRQHPDFPDLWMGTVYPRNPGWDQLTIASDSMLSHNFYVLTSNQWAAKRIVEKIALNKREFADNAPKVKKKRVFSPINNIWFFLAFLVAIAYLWFEPKLFGTL